MLHASGEVHFAENVAPLGHGGKHMPYNDNFTVSVLNLITAPLFAVPKSRLACDVPLRGGLCSIQART